MAEDSEAEQQWPSNFLQLHQNRGRHSRVWIVVCKNIKKGYSVVTLFYKINNDISIVNKNYEKYTNKQKHHDYLDGN